MRYEYDVVHLGLVGVVNVPAYGVWKCAGWYVWDRSAGEHVWVYQHSAVMTERAE